MKQHELEAALRELESEELAFLADERAAAKRGIAQRVKDSKRVHRRTGDPRAGIREYCRGNRWLEENAKAVGNW